MGVYAGWEGRGELLVRVGEGCCGGEGEEGGDG